MGPRNGGLDYESKEWRPKLYRYLITRHVGLTYSKRERRAGLWVQGLEGWTIGARSGGLNYSNKEWMAGQ